MGRFISSQFLTVVRPFDGIPHHVDSVQVGWFWELLFVTALAPARRRRRGKTLSIPASLRWLVIPATAVNGYPIWRPVSMACDPVRCGGSQRKSSGFHETP